MNTAQVVAVLEHFNQGGAIRHEVCKRQRCESILARGVRGLAPLESFEILESQKGHFPGFGRGFWQF